MIVAAAIALVPPAPTRRRFSEGRMSFPEKKFGFGPAEAVEAE